MKILSYISIFFLILYFIIFLVFLIKTKKPFKNLFINAIIGIAALVTLFLLKKYTGVVIPFNWWTVSSSSFGGIPAVCGIVIIKIIFNI